MKILSRLNIKASPEFITDTDEIESKLGTVAASGTVSDLIKILYDASNGLFGELPISFLFYCPMNGLEIKKPYFDDVDFTDDGHLSLFDSWRGKSFIDKSNKYEINAIELFDPRCVDIYFEDVSEGTKAHLFIRNAKISCDKEKFLVDASTCDLLTQSGRVIEKGLKCKLQISFPSGKVNKKPVQILHL